MLSTFWQLLAVPMIGSTILRLTIAIIAIVLGYRTFKAAKILASHTGKHKLPFAVGVVEIICGVFLLFGFLTQVFALILCLTSLSLFFTRRHYAATAIESRMFYVLLALSSLTILFYGAGIIAIDLPL